MPKILVSEKISPDALALLREKHEVEEFLEWEPADLMEKLKGFDALIVRSKTKVTQELIDAAPSLKVIGRAGAGLDNVDKEYAESKGIKVINTPTANLLSVAELTLGLALSLLRFIPSADRTTRDGLWEKKKFKGTEVSKKTWGIIGFGNVGKLVAGLLKGFDCRLLAYDPYASKEKAAQLGVELLPLDTIMAESDIISVHVPLLDSTRGLVGEKELSMMKESAIIINISRGGIIDEAALYKALKEKMIRGAALDVFENEPPEGSPLLSLDNTVFTCHLGASTSEAQDRVGSELAEKMIEALA
jgi:D-3-phosphoglycerate dehydrogenase / 2-oxoglutarate reductase